MKKFCAIILVIALAAFPLSVSAAPRGYSIDDGVVGGHQFSATLNASSASACATLVSMYHVVRINGFAATYYMGSGQRVDIPMNASGKNYYIEANTYGTTNYPIAFASATYYVNDAWATFLSVPN